ncbi:hypothetical protein TOTSKI_13130 [Facklamia hominis]
MGSDKSNDPLRITNRKLKAIFWGGVNLINACFNRDTPLYMFECKHYSPFPEKKLVSGEWTYKIF